MPKRSDELTLLLLSVTCLCYWCATSVKLNYHASPVVPPFPAFASPMLPQHPFLAPSGSPGYSSSTPSAGAKGPLASISD